MVTNMILSGLVNAVPNRELQELDLPHEGVEIWLYWVLFIWPRDLRQELGSIHRSWGLT